MSKTNNKKNITPEQVNNSVVLGGENLGISDEEAFDIIKGANEANMQDLTQGYFKFEKKGRYVFKVLGFSVARIDEKDVPVVEMLTEDGESIINGDTVLYGACRKLQQLPAFIIVNYVGDAKSQTGNRTYKDLKVSTFPAAK